MRFPPSLAAAWLLPCCGTLTSPPQTMTHDVHSHARPDQVRVVHLDLDLTLDFARKVAFGSAALDVERHDPSAPLILDTQGLAIESVLDDAGNALSYRLGDADPILGRALRIDLPAGRTRAVIRYETSPDAAAMQWLSREQTAGGERPFLFTQGQAILTRSWIPLQDSPAVRQTWTASIRAPEGLVPLMSARKRTAGTNGEPHRFEMDLPVPSYLIALACGELAHRDISGRCAVWAEPAVVGAAADELEDMESMVRACEELFGPYRWGRYDLLILPPSFPFGGMENPCLTFATPTILAGDKSLVSLVAHELAHSWSGNLVTNATWRDFWLNEGFTVYLEQRIMEHVYGKARADMEIALALHDLREEMAQLPPEDQILHVRLDGRNPDDGMTGVPYHKGAALLRRLEQIEGRERFDAFLRDYFAGHAFRSITTDDFIRFLKARLPETSSPEPIDLDLWIERPGLPPDLPEPTSPLFADVDSVLSGFLEQRDAAALARRTKGWVTQQWLRFLEGLPRDVDSGVLAELDRALRFTRSRNSEILCAWLEQCIRSDYAPSSGKLQEFLCSVGRRKFLKPLYEALIARDGGKEEALRIYRKARPRYHAVSTRTIDKMLGWNEGR
ncbi:MAG: M1 family metallopeptidase [Planctomycetota bacterium]